MSGGHCCRREQTPVATDVARAHDLTRLGHINFDRYGRIHAVQVQRKVRLLFLDKLRSSRGGADMRRTLEARRFSFELSDAYGRTSSGATLNYYRGDGYQLVSETL